MFEDNIAKMKKRKKNESRAMKWNQVKYNDVGDNFDAHILNKLLKQTKKLVNFQVTVVIKK